MTATATQTTTFTVADIRKVVENFAADFSMMAQATGLWSRESVAEVVYDLRVFAEYGYLVSVSVILRDAGGNKIRAAVYSVSEAASSWKSEQPGNNLWPKTVGGSLNVIADMTSAWWNKTDAQRKSFIENHGLNGSWPPSRRDNSLHSLQSSSRSKICQPELWVGTNKLQQIIGNERR
jgi:hypothetical protein